MTAPGGHNRAAADWVCAFVDLREHRHGGRLAQRRMLWPMEPKDSFMRFVVLGSIVVVGAFALFIALGS